MNVGLISPPKEERLVIVRSRHWFVDEADAFDDQWRPHGSCDLVSVPIATNLKEQTESNARSA